MVISCRATTHRFPVSRIGNNTTTRILSENSLDSPNHFRYVVGDVKSRHDRNAALEMATREFGGLDALINNAGMGALGRFDQADEARLRQIMEVNFFAPA